MVKKIQVLVIDDEPEILKTIQRYFSFFEHIEIQTAASYNEAKKILDSNNPRIAIVDINLPDGNGLDLIKQIRSHSQINQVIIITGYSNLNRVMDALEFGAIDYLTKPLDMDDLKLVVEEAYKRYNRWYKLFKDELKNE